MGRDAEDRESLADLADLLLNVSRLIRASTPVPPETVVMNDTERQVMRLVDLHPGISPSSIAQRARLHRANVSAALRGLESAGMVVRTLHGRRAELHPTALAGRNLARLRAGWADQLGELVGDDVTTVQQCVRLLARLESAMTAPDGG